MLDPITFEILRHRLWMINDEQGEIAVRISGSPLVYEVKDFSASLLTPEGDSLFIGPHVTRLSIALHHITKHVLQIFGSEIVDGDMFYTNDPWSGAAHQNDCALVAPIFHAGDVVAWTGIAMHELDVGGPAHGGFSTRPEDAYSEAPLIPPIKLVEKGEIRKDLEALVLRNTRTAELNGLNIRSRMAAQNVARQRVLDIIEEYGKDALLETQQQIIAMVRRAVGRRLLELPDGTWSVDRCIDHTGFENRLIHIRLKMTKRGDRLTFDFTGTDPQSPGAVNSAPPGLDGGVYSAMLPMLCYDMPWCPGALQQTVDIISEPGTVNNATFPAAVSTATVGAIWATGDAVRACLAKMLACSDQYRDEAQATWAPGMLGNTVTAKNRFGRIGQMGASVRIGGAGASGAKDGMDAGGPPGAPTLTIENVETNETYNRIGLVLYRKIQSESAGPGKYRGGGGVETMIVPYGNVGQTTVVQSSQGHHHPEQKGVFGGYPGSVQGTVILRDTNVNTLLASGQIPTDLADVAAQSMDVVPAKGSVPLGDQDVAVSWYTGGAGYGDPLERDPLLVARDVLRLTYTPERALALYGVAVNADGRVDVAATQRERFAVRQARLQEGSPSDPGQAARTLQANAERVLGIGDTVDVVRTADETLAICNRCRYVYGPGSDDPKRGAHYRERSLGDLSDLQRFATGENYVLREFFCPDCGILVDAQVVEAGSPMAYDSTLDLAESTREEQSPEPALALA